MNASLATDTNGVKYWLLFSPKHRSQPGPKGPSQELIDAVVEMKRRNPTWGCPRIAEQIALAFEPTSTRTSCVGFSACITDRMDWRRVGCSSKRFEDNRCRSISARTTIRCILFWPCMGVFTPIALGVALYFHSQSLVEVSPLASTSYSKTVAVVFNRANFCDVVL